MRRIGMVLAAMAALAASAAAAPPPPTAPLALKEIAAARQAGLFTLRIELNRRWKNSLLAGRSAVSLAVLYETTGDSSADYAGRIVSRNGRLTDTLSGRGAHFEPVRVVRPTTRAARFTHPVDEMFADPAHPGTLRIAVVLHVGRRVDRLPRHGWFAIPAPPQ